MRVMVGMSGGVDSTAAARLLLDSGYEVVGATLVLHGEYSEENPRRDIADAISAAKRLGIEHHLFDLRPLFKEKVMDSFVNSYLSGQTPNPCIECNRHIKFGRMMTLADELCCEKISTGHYAEVVFDEKSGRYSLLRAEDIKKDQSYVLYSLTQEQLSRLILPLSRKSKEEVRSIAANSGCQNFDKPDSQDICFIPDGDYAGFIERYTSKTSPCGDFTDTDGNAIGRHSGIIRYTIGQRRGLGQAFGRPVFVIGKDAAENRVILGDESELFSRELFCRDVNIISGERLSSPIRATVKLRYSAKDAPALIEPSDCGVKIIFDEPQRAVTPGQAAVFYDGRLTIGGGTII